MRPLTGGAATTTMAPDPGQQCAAHPQVPR